MSQPGLLLSALGGALALCFFSAVALQRPYDFAKWTIAALPIFASLGVLSTSSFLGIGVFEAVGLVPMYVGVLSRVPRPASRLPWLLGFLLFFLGLLCLAESLNPLLPNPAVAVVGLHGWLIAVPALFVGRRVMRDRAYLREFVRAITICAAPFVLSGLLDVALVYGTGRTILDRLRPSAVSPQAGTVGGAGTIQFHRVQGLLPYPEQLFLVALASVAAGLAWSALASRRSERRWGLVSALLATLLALTSGERLGVVLVPAMFISIALVTGGRRALTSALAGLASPALIALAAGVSLAGLFNYIVGVASTEQSAVLSSGFANAQAVTTVGLGVGADTGAARHVGGPLMFAAFGGWQESYFVKAWLELGVVGFTIVCALLLCLVIVTLATARSVSDPKLRYIAAICFGFSLVFAVMSIKTSVLDLEPTSVYFWFMVGVCLRIPMVELAERASLMSLTAPADLIGRRRRHSNGPGQAEGRSTGRVPRSTVP